MTAGRPDSVCGRPVRPLGEGEEAFVCTDGETVFKVFKGPPGPYMGLGAQLEGRFAGCAHIPDVGCLEDGGRAVFAYRYEESSGYAGGMRGQMAELLVEAACRGVCFRNVKPLNLRVAGGRLVMVDLGRDVVPYSARDFLFMAQRAYLSLEPRGDGEFRELASRALGDWGVPELRGFREFFNSAYGELLRRRGDTRPEQLVLPEDRWLNGVFPDVALRRSVPDPSAEALADARSGMVPGEEAVLVTPNRFFRPAGDVPGRLARAGFAVVDWEDSPARPDGDLYASDLTAYRCAAMEPLAEPVSLMIKACYQDTPVLERCVRHIVGQLDHPDPFDERIVVVDCKRDSFLRQYAAPDEAGAISALERLAAEGVIDRYVVMPDDPGLAADINSRWFGIDCAGSHSVRNIPVASQLFGFESCRNRLILQCDVDVMIVRRDPAHRFLKDMADALRGDPLAVSVGFNIAHRPGSDPVPYSHPGGGGYVPEVRICLLDRGRLESLRPMVNAAEDGRPELSWYRSAEKTQELRGMHSLRGGDPRTFYVHPQNTAKADAGFWMGALDSAECGWVPEEQYGRVDLVEDPRAWTRRADAGFVFVVCGRNMPEGMFLRCWDSISRQTRGDWAAVIVDDCSDGGLDKYIRHATHGSGGRAITIRNPERRGMLRNVESAVRDHMTDGGQVAVIVDMDDMLLSDRALSGIRELYLGGHDAVIGNALKSTRGILAFEPDFNNARDRRTGDVWIHPRTFRKRLFDAIDPSEFLGADGGYVDHFTELCYMVPVAESASSPAFQPWPVYYWEPRIPRDERHYALVEETKALVRSRPPHRPLPPARAGEVNPAGSYGRLIGEGTITVMCQNNEEPPADRREDADALAPAVGPALDAVICGPGPDAFETAASLADECWPGYEAAVVESLGCDRDPGGDAGIRMLEEVWSAIGSKRGSAAAVLASPCAFGMLARCLGVPVPPKVRHLDAFTVAAEDAYRALVSARASGQNLAARYPTRTDAVEIDITSRCNLNCVNCDRLCGHRPDADLDPERLAQLLREFDEKEIALRRVRIMGGEPALHPRFAEVMEIMERWKEAHPGAEVVVYTNGIAPPAGVPEGLRLRNTGKTSRVNPKFDPPMASPADLGVRADYSAGCWVTSECGLGIGTDGLVYPCAAGAAIAVARGLDVGMRSASPSEEPYRKQKSVLCRLCGHFLNRCYPSRLGFPSAGDLQFRTESWKDVNGEGEHDGA